MNYYGNQYPGYGYNEGVPPMGNYGYGQPQMMPPTGFVPPQGGYGMPTQGFGGFNPNGGNVNDQLIFSTNNNNRWDLSCINETDRFSTKNEKAKLVYPIGLISSDEIRLAYKGKSTYTYYLRPNSGNWINSPRNFPSIVYGDGNNINVFHLYDSGSLGNGNPVNYGAVRPVISLKPEIEYTEGDGSKNNPYVIDTSEVENP